MRRPPILLTCLLLALCAAACGGDDDDDSASQATATATPAPGHIDAASISKDLSAKPHIDRPSGAPPAQLQKVDIVTGKGKAAKPGDTVSVRYVGNSWSTGEQFDASWDHGNKPFTFPLGAGQVIAGWDQGVAGMKPGGRRLLVIPPALGYGAQSPTPAIAPNETLVFVVDLKQIRR
jgi:peptidylprolyl isomerase